MCPAVRLFFPLNSPEAWFTTITQACSTVTIDSGLVMTMDRSDILFRVIIVINSKLRKLNTPLIFYTTFECIQHHNLSKYCITFVLIQSDIKTTYTNKPS